MDGYKVQDTAHPGAILPFSNKVIFYCLIEVFRKWSYQVEMIKHFLRVFRKCGMILGCVLFIKETLNRL